MNPVAQSVDDAGRKILAATGPNLAVQLSSALGEFLGWPYKTAPGRVVDGNAGAAGPFASVVYLGPQGGGEDLNAIPADAVGIVIDGREVIDLDGLRAAYAAVAAAKRLAKSPAPRTKVPTTTVTLGVIFALPTVASPQYCRHWPTTCRNSRWLKHRPRTEENVHGSGSDGNKKSEEHGERDSRACATVSGAPSRGTTR
jgi:hypothetical protein